MKYFSFLLIASLILTSCEKAVTFDLEESSPKLVVEATIETNRPPLVILSKSQNFFAQITPDILANSFVRNAEVYVSNGIVTHKLKEYTAPLGNGYTFYFYSIDSSNLSTAFLGQTNTQYSLRIVAEGKEYTAVTKIPAITRRIDSLFWKQAPGSNDTNKVALMVRATDRAGYGDYIRYFTKRNSEPFYPAFNSVYDDQIIDGTSYEIEVERGVDRTQDLPDDYTLFDKGDTVTLKLCQIDKATYDFWRTMEFSYGSIGNPFASPTKVLSNISNEALGYFGGYAPQFRTIIIPH
ncbi:MAG TPA: DUF4249 domain-containing protein [Chitinophagaceae bacterium]|jgi:hypothetical protein|nr:DUF4249 domain-containing protein [Chitinophagaceae bacterium]